MQYCVTINKQKFNFGSLFNFQVLYSTGKPKVQQAAKMRHVSTRPDKILDAPDLLDDFYLHLLDWSVNNHLVWDK